MKLQIKNITSVVNHWNKYIDETNQTEIYHPVCGLALVKWDEGEELWSYIDVIHISSQSCPEAFEDLQYIETIYYLGNPNL